MASGLETNLEDTPLPKWEDRHTNISRRYSTILNSNLRRNAGAGPYRQAAYDRIAGNQLGAEEAIRQNATYAYGGMNPSGRTGALIAQQRANAPYGQADIAAREMARSANLETGQAGLAKSQAVANRYISLLNPYLLNKQIENKTALGLAQIEANSNLGIPSGGGGGSDWLGPTIGAAGSITSAIILASS